MSSTHLLGVLACAFLFTACGKQGEGERCDLNSGNLDCEAGLLCRSAEQLSVELAGRAALCCPPDDVPPTVNACRAGANLPPDPGAGMPTTPPPDAGAPAGDGGA